MIGSRFNPVKPQTPTMTEKIFSKLYLCSVPAFQSRTVEDIRLRGVTMTGIRDLDEAMKNDWLKRYATINDMIEFFKRGVPVRILVPAEVKDIYDTIQTHLTQWLEAMRTGLNINDPPLDDLMAMDRFAAKLYVHAAPMFTEEALKSALAESLMKVQRLHAGNFFSNVPKAPDPEMDPIEASKKETEAARKEPRVSLEEGFKKSMAGIRRYGPG